MREQVVSRPKQLAVTEPGMMGMKGAFAMSGKRLSKDQESEMTTPFVSNAGQTNRGVGGWALSIRPF